MSAGEPWKLYADGKLVGMVIPKIGLMMRNDTTLVDGLHSAIDTAPEIEVRVQIRLILDSHWLRWIRSQYP